MKTLITAAFGALLVATSASADVTGLWKTAEGNSGGHAIVDMQPCADDAAMMCGTITKIVGNENTTPEGKAIIKGMVSESATNWVDGQIWAPDEDKWYDAKMEYKGDVLAVAGCVLGGLICRGQDWTRP